MKNDWEITIFFFDPLVKVYSLRTGTSPSLRTVNQLFLWASYSSSQTVDITRGYQPFPNIYISNTPKRWSSDIQIYPLVMTNSSPWYRWPIEIDGLPINSMVIFPGELLNHQMCLIRCVDNTQFEARASSGIGRTSDDTWGLAFSFLHGNQMQRIRTYSVMVWVCYECSNHLIHSFFSSNPWNLHDQHDQHDRAGPQGRRARSCQVVGCLECHGTGTALGDPIEAGHGLSVVGLPWITQNVWIVWQQLWRFMLIYDIYVDLATIHGDVNYSKL